MAYSSGNTFASGSGGLRFKSRAGQIGRSVANGSPLLRYFFKGAVLFRRNDAEMGPANSLHASAQYSEYNKRFDLIYFSVSTIVDTWKEGPGQMFPIPSFLTQPCWDPQVLFRN